MMQLLCHSLQETTRSQRVPTRIISLAASFTIPGGMLSIPGDFDLFNDMSIFITSHFVTALKKNLFLWRFTDTVKILAYTGWQGNSKFNSYICKRHC